MDDLPGRYFYSHQLRGSELTCSECGSAVTDLPQHERFHDWLTGWLTWLAQGPDA